VIRLHRTPATLTVVSRLARPRVIAVLGAALAAVGLASARSAPLVALSAAVAAALLVLLGARTLHARFERGQLLLRPAVPFQRPRRRPLASFTVVRIETFAEARRRKADRLARGYAERSGAPMPGWLRAPDAPGVNDGLRRIVLVALDGEPFPVTAWLAEEEDLEPVRSAIEDVLG
jgi:hypothetical protein